MGERSKAALIIPGALAAQHGGAAMRCRALWLAMQQVTATTLAEIPCDRERDCSAKCQVSGRSMPEAPGWYFDLRYCPAYFDDLVRHLADQGVGRVVCTGLETYPYVLRFAESTDLDVVFDLHNVQAAVHRSLLGCAPPGSRFDAIYDERELALVIRAEGAVISAADEIWTCSEDDRRLLDATYPAVATQAVKVVPNAVEVPQVRPAAAPPERIVFTGLLHYYPNVQAAIEIIRRIAPARTNGAAR